MWTKLVLFVCTGNICRSPMAEYLLRPKLYKGWKTQSAGLYAAKGATASKEAIAVLAQRKIDLTLHHSQPLTREQVDAATMIVVMTRTHYEECCARFPKINNKVFLLTTFDPDTGSSDIGDPMGLEKEFYEKTCVRLETAMDGLLRYILAFKSEEGML